MKNVQLRNSFLLLLTAIIWGSAFVAQSVGMDYVGPFTFTFARSVIGGIVLIPCIALLRKARSAGMRRDAHKVDVATQPHLARESVKTDSMLRKARSAGMRGDAHKIVTKIELLGGICCGVALFAASNFQQIGISYTTVGKAGFITALYVVIVPILGLFLKKRVSFLIWICASHKWIVVWCITENYQFRASLPITCEVNGVPSFFL